MDDVEPICAEICRKDGECGAGEWEKQPMLSVVQNHQLFEFSFEDSTEQSCAEVIEHWKKIMHEQSAVCVFAAHLQDIDVSPEERLTSHSVWILERMKTKLGEWPSESTIHESGNELKLF